MLVALVALSLANVTPPPERVEHFDDPVVAARFLASGDAVFVTTHRVVAMARDGSRQSVAAAGCAPIERAAISVDGSWVALACRAPAASGVFRVGLAARAAPLALQGDARFTFCGDWLHVAIGDGERARLTRHRVGAWSTVEADIDGACAGDALWIATPPGARALGAVVDARDKTPSIAIVDRGTLAAVDATGARRAGPAYAGTPEGAARVGDAWVVVDDGQLITLPTPLAATAAAGFVVTPEQHLWVWQGPSAQRLVWTPAMALRPKLPPAPPLLLSPPVDARADFVRFRERELDAVATFVPSGDDLYGYVLVLSDRRGGAERIDAEACAVAAKHWAEHVGREVGAVVDLSACARGPRTAVVKHGAAGAIDGVTFRATTIEGLRVTLAEMDGYGAGTELWLWRYDPRTGDFEDATGGVPPVLELPGEP